MRVSRFLPVLVAGAVFTAAAAPASAATPGVGSTVGSLEVLSLDVGDLLDLDVLTDFAAANTDPDVSDAGAAAALKALAISAPALLDDPLEIGVLDVASSGEEQTASSDGVDIPGDTPVVGGSLLPAALSAVLADAGAGSTTKAGIGALDILGGIAGLDTTELGIAANSLTEQADGSRALQIKNLAVLDLGDLLAGLGIPLDLLSIDTILALIDGLGITDQLTSALEGLGLPVGTLDTLDQDSILGLVDQVGDLQTLVAEDPALLCEEINGPLADVAGSILGAANPDVALTTCEELVSAVTSLPIVADLLGETLDTILGLLNDTALLELTALDVSIVTAATDSLETSVADITATIGGLTVAGLDLPATDLAAAIETAKAQLDGLLATISPLLGGLGLLDIGVLEQDAGVSEDGDAIVSEATFTGLRVDVAGLTDGVLGGVLAGLPIENSIGDLIGDVPANPVTDLLGLDSSALSALGDGLSLQVASLGQTSTFTEVLNNTATPAAPASPELPRTGSNDALMLALAAIAAGGALGIRRVVRTKD